MLSLDEQQAVRSTVQEAATAFYQQIERGVPQGQALLMLTKVLLDCPLQEAGAVLDRVFQEYDECTEQERLVYDPLLLLLRRVCWHRCLSDRKVSGEEWRSLTKACVDALAKVEA